MVSALPGSCALRNCGFSQLVVTWLRFPPNVETTSRASGIYEGEMDPRQVSFVNVIVVFFLVAFICYLSIPLLLNRFNVVAVNGRDDVEMWSRPYKFYNACDTAIGLELEDTFLANVGRKGGDVGIDSSLFHEAASKLWLYSQFSDVKC